MVTSSGFVYTKSRLEILNCSFNVFTPLHLLYLECKIIFINFAPNRNSLVCRQRPGSKFTNFLQQIHKIFVTFNWICEAITHKNRYFLHLLQIRLTSTDNCFKNSFSFKNLKMLRPKVTKTLRIWHKKFCEYGPCSLTSNV